MSLFRTNSVVQVNVEMIMGKLLLVGLFDYSTTTTIDLSLMLHALSLLYTAAPTNASLNATLLVICRLLMIISSTQSASCSAPPWSKVHS